MMLTTDDRNDETTVCVRCLKRTGRFIIMEERLSRSEEGFGVARCAATIVDD